MVDASTIVAAVAARLLAAFHEETRIRVSAEAELSSIRDSDSYGGSVDNGQKWLSQIIEECARQLEIRGVKSFRKSLVDESQRILGLIALPFFSEETG